LVCRYPIVEQWAFLLFFISLVFLSLTGFFFFLFAARGLHGYFLLFHVAVGGIFAVTLAIMVILRVRLFCSPDIWHPDKKNSQKNNISINRTQVAAAWLVVISGLIQVISSLILMMPIFSTEVNADITALHRWAGLVALLAAVRYAIIGKKSCFFSKIL
jgi:hypothetical protein